MAPPPFFLDVAADAENFFLNCCFIYLELFYITLIYSTVLDMTLFYLTSKSILLLTGIIFGVFLGPGQHLQVSESPVACGQ